MEVSSLYLKYKRYLNVGLFLTAVLSVGWNIFEMH